MGSPKIPTPQSVPPPPTPAMITPKPQGAPTLGGTFLTASIPSTATSNRAQRKTLLGQ
jgi:hypothetical protein